MTALKEYNEVAEAALQLPIRGKVYTLPAVDIQTGLRLNAITTQGAEPDLAAVELYKLALGPVWDEFIADDVPLNAAMRAGMVAINNFMYGRDYAAATWESGLNPQAAAEIIAKQTGNRAQRRAVAKSGTSK